MKKKNDFMVEGRSFYRDIGNLILDGNYAGWFTNHIAKDYISSLPRKYGATNDPQERFALLMQASRAAQIYSMLVYYIYPSRAEFRKKIDSDNELSANFRMIKEWLGRNGGKEAADYELRYLRGGA